MTLVARHCFWPVELVSFFLLDDNRDCRRQCACRQRLQSRFWKRKKKLNLEPLNTRFENSQNTRFIFFYFFPPDVFRFTARFLFFFFSCHRTRDLVKTNLLHSSPTSIPDAKFARFSRFRSAKRARKSYGVYDSFLPANPVCSGKRALEHCSASAFVQEEKDHVSGICP